LVLDTHLGIVAWCDGSTSTAVVRRFDMEDREIRAALDRHWAASDTNDFEGEHQIYREDAVLEYPQSSERIRGRRKIGSLPKMTIEIERARAGSRYAGAGLSVRRLPRHHPRR
jgi:hypothetical protein